jgi:hypothetical protein
MTTRDRTTAAVKAWQTRRKPTYRAAQSEAKSKQALETWAHRQRFHLVFLDGPSGKPRTGIVDAILIRHRRSNADAFEVFFVQLKGGGAGFTPPEMTRLKRAAEGVHAEPLVVLHDASGTLHFLPREP